MSTEVVEMKAVELRPVRGWSMTTYRKADPPKRRHWSQIKRVKQTQTIITEYTYTRRKGRAFMAKPRITGSIFVELQNGHTFDFPNGSVVEVRKEKGPEHTGEWP